MTSDRPRRIAAATLALAATAGLSACGTGIDAQVNEQYQPAIGANVRGGDVELHNALLVLNDDDTFSFSAGLVNETDEEQTLESATVVPLSGEAPAAAEPLEPSTDVAVAPNALFTVGAQGELAGLEVEGLEEGRYATVTLSFSGAGEVTVDVPVVSRDASYADVAAAPVGQPDEEATPDDELGNAGEAESEGANP